MNELGLQSRVEVDSGPGLVSHIFGQLVFLEPSGGRADPTFDLWTEDLMWMVRRIMINKSGFLYCFC